MSIHGVSMLPSPDCDVSSVNSSSTSVGPSTTIGNIPENAPDVFLTLRSIVFSLINSQSMSSIGPIVTSIEVVVLIATTLLSASVHFTDMTLPLPSIGSTSENV